MQPVTAKIPRLFVWRFTYALAISVGVSLFGLPIEAKAACIQEDKAVECNGFIINGFLSDEDSLSVTINESTTVRNFQSVIRRGICPLSLPAIATGDSSNITNDGLILTFGVCGSAIQTGNGANVTNTGTIDTFDVLSFGIDVGMDSTVINHGSITARGFVSSAIFAGAGTTIINEQNASIETSGSVGTGIVAQGQATIRNAGLIRTTGDNSHGIQGSTNGLITNSGTIEVGGLQSNGIRFGGDAVTISNSGSIIGTYTGPVGVITPEDGIFVLSGQTTLANSGTIAMSSESAAGIRTVVTDLGNATIVNSGTILAPKAGIFASASSGVLNIRNTGTITGIAGPAIDLNTTAGSGVFITNTGVLSAPNQAPALQGGPGREEVINTGLISGGMDLAGGNDLLTLQTGGRLDGLIDGGAGFDDLVLTGSGTFDAQITGFEELTKFGNGLWQIASDVSLSDRARVLEGVLDVASNARLSSPTVDIFGEGVLALGGRVSAAVTNMATLSVATGAVISGSYTQSSDGLLAINANMTETEPVLRIDGTASLDGQLSISFSDARPILDGTRVAALTANSISGTFSSVGLAPSPFLAATPFVDTVTAGAVFTRKPYETAARSENAIAVARVLDRAISNAPEEALPLFSALDSASFNQAADTLDGISISLPNVLASLDILAVRNAAQEAMGHGGSQQAWPEDQAMAWGSISRTNGSLLDGAGETFNHAATRYAAGISIPITTDTGMSIALSQTDYHAKKPASSGDKRLDGQALLFSAAMQGHWTHWRASAGIAKGTLEGRHMRLSAFDNSRALSGMNNGNSLAASGHISRTGKIGSIDTNVDVDLTYVRVKRGNFTEQGNALDTLSYQTQRERSVRGSIGVSGTVDLISVAPSLRLSLSHELLSSRRSVVAELISLSDSPFDLSLRPEERLWVISELNIPFRVHSSVEVSLNAGGVLNDDTGGHHIGIEARWFW